MHHGQPNTKTLEHVAALARTQFWEDIFGVHDFFMMDVVFRDVRCPYFMHTFVRKTLVIVVSGLRGLSANQVLDTLFCDVFAFAHQVWHKLRADVITDVQLLL